MKKCSLCKQEKGLDQFRNDKSRKDGLQKLCKSCQSDRALVYHTTPKGRYVHLQSLAKSRGHDFSLSREEYESVIFDGVRCHYCNDPVDIKSTGHGLDRISSKLGYNKENIVPCCGTCNRMKLDHSKEDFLSHVAKINKNSTGP